MRWQRNFAKERRVLPPTPEKIAAGIRERLEAEKLWKRTREANKAEKRTMEGIEKAERKENGG